MTTVKELARQVGIALLATLLGAFVFNCGRIAVVAEMSRRARVQAQEAQLRAEAANTFLANKSHELRTPLNAILGFSTMLRDSPAIPEALRAELEAALVRLDADRVRQAIAQIEGFNPTLAAFLQPYAHRFQYTPLLQMLQRESP